MNKSNAQYATDTSESDTQLHPDIKLNRGNYERHQPRPGIAVTNDTWKQHIDAALIIWDKLSEKEILSTEGSENLLTTLIQKRYAITRGIANQQVKKFLKKISH